MRAIDRYDSLFVYYAQQYHVDWRLMKAQMLAESAGDPDAISRSGAVGLTQFMERTWEEWWDGTPGIQGEPQWQRDNPEASIKAQASFMSWLIARHKINAIALAAYNWGTGNVSRSIQQHGGFDLSKLPTETRQYVARTLELYERLQPLPGEIV